MYGCREGILKRLFLICGMLAMLVVFSVPALAQEEATGPELTVQQEATTGSEAQEDESAAGEQYEEEANSPSEGQQENSQCPGAVQAIEPLVFDIEGGSSQTPSFEIQGDTFLVTLDVMEVEPDSINSADVDIRDAETGFSVENIFRDEVGVASTFVNEGSGSYFLDIFAQNQAFTVTVEDCRGSNEDGGGSEGGGGGAGDTPGEQEKGEIIMPPELIGKKLAETGGPSMLLPIGALILGAGFLGYAVIRRRN